MKPVVICIGGMELTNWTSMSLQRTKETLTGQLELSIFAGTIPNSPMIREAMAGCEIQVYIAGQLAFTGTGDARTGTGKKKSEGRMEHTGRTRPSAEKSAQQTSGEGSVNIGPDEYTIKLTARGKTKRLIDSSHQHPTTNMLRPTTKEVCENLVKPWGTKIEWKGEVIKLDKQRFRDGARVVDELYRVATENCYFMYETRDGKLCVTDGCAGTQGDPLILGQNILTFSAEQSEDKAKSDVKVKGQRTKKEIRGKKSLDKTFKEFKNKDLKDRCTLTVQHYGDADDKTLERRARFEMNKRNAASKKITIEVFHVQTPSGAPWDIGNLHYVEVPCEGIYDTFECTELTYHVNAEKELKTTLTLNPPPSGGSEGSGGGFGLSSIDANIGSARRSQANIPIVNGQYPLAWGPPPIVALPFMTLVDAAARALTDPEPAEEERAPPLVLPPWFGEDNT